MKSRGYLLFILILSFIRANAQELVSLGIRGGAGGSDILAFYDGENYGDLFLPQFSCSADLYADIRLNRYNESMSILLEPGYCLKGATDEDAMARKLHYLSLSAFFNLQTESKLYIGGGPELSYLIKANHRIAGTKTDRSSYYESFEYSLAAEAGYQPVHWIKAGIRYGLGFKKITDQTMGDGNGNLIPALLYNHYLHLVMRIRLIGITKHRR